MAKEMAAGRWRGQAKPEEAAATGKREVPKPYMSAQYREDTMHTTGGGGGLLTHQCRACSGCCSMWRLGACVPVCV